MERGEGKEEERRTTNVTFYFAWKVWGEHFWNVFLRDLLLSLCDKGLTRILIGERKDALTSLYNRDGIDPCDEGEGARSLGLKAEILTCAAEEKGDVPEVTQDVSFPPKNGVRCVSLAENAADELRHRAAGNKYAERK